MKKINEKKIDEEKIDEDDPIPWRGHSTVQLVQAVTTTMTRWSLAVEGGEGIFVMV